MSDQARLLKWNEALRTENLLYLAPQKDENSNKYYAEAYIKRGRYKDGVYYQTPKMRINKITDEYIEFKGGPGTGSATSSKLKDLISFGVTFG